MPVTVKARKGDVVVDTDEYIKAGTTAETLAKLRPAFSKDGTVTAGNASGINDGAAVVGADDGGRGASGAGSSRWRGSCPGRRRGSIRRSWASGPIPASRKALEKAGWKVDDLDLVEANEAFAAQACAVNKDMGWDTGQGERQWRGDRAWATRSAPRARGC